MASKVIDYSQLEIAFRLVVAALLGAIVGLEREHIHKPAGMRTHMLVSTGAALFTVVSMEVALSNSIVDPTRIMGNIVVGIGFLGAGTIFRMEDRIAGLTTAASLWAVAGVGMAVGVGFYFLGTIAATIIYFILVLGKLELNEKKK